MKLSFGMVGGGNGAFIGNVHRRGAIMDNLAELTAGCFTRNMEKNRQTAEEWGVRDLSRVYANYQEMADAESKREDGIDFVSIVTPTDTHYAIAKCFLEHGIHVVCDKPICLTLDEGLELQAIAQEKGLEFGVTYTYASYAVIRQAREMIDAGVIGNIVKIVAEYPQDWLIVSTVAEKSDQALWRLDPRRAGPSACCADIGTHLEALIARMTGLKLERVMARFTHYKDSVLEHDIDVMLEYEGGIPGTMWASQIASGNDCGVCIRVYGDKGAIEWRHTHPMEITYTPLAQPTRTIVANREYNYAACTEQCRLPAGHPEGFYEAFGNIYHSFCTHLIAKKTGGDPGTFRHPTIEDGIAGLRFVDACVKSNAEGSRWVSLYE
ncbi:MAG: Gfo/Idh/MocA family oxidoreductase [Butyricicoccus pullicaecorum]|jgi:predicted dehydrogenase|nr:Gfo/Idh/MocA family oxidoreductase [Butyricicoccus pullicaecorum]